jgi:cytochrome c oxidase subunit 1
MRLQLGFPTFHFIAEHHYQFVTMQDDHGDLPADRAVPRRFRQLPIPLMCGARDYGSRTSTWSATGYLLAVLVLMASFRAGWPDRGRLTLYPPQAILPGTAERTGASR